MELQNKVSYYLCLYGISKSHMARVVNVSIQQLSAWSKGKLVLPDYHMKKIQQYLDALEAVDKFLKNNSLVL